MSTKENLDNYQSAYQPEFRFNDENVMTLSFYAERMCKVLRASKAESILSLGIGHRVVSQAILNEFKHSIKRYLIVEGSPEIIADYKNRFPDLPAGTELLQTYFEEFKTDEKFDAIEMGFVLEHVDDPAQIINIYKKFLNPGGTIFLAVPNARSMHRQLGHLAGLLKDMYNLSAEDLQLGHKRYFDLQSFQKLITGCGLKIKKVEGNFMKPFTTGQLNSLELKPEIWRALMEYGIDHPDSCNSIYVEASI
jgi:2-polyprenyl-3-methyl-5-hydroxy-6-metoxy-1,4-benzoquinol methylase